ncbi:MAG: hypothetical protein QFE16_15720 [Pseudomonadota bacterium]|nr:hypothetical protein [Pseudomonadota bacterium]
MHTERNTMHSRPGNDEARTARNGSGLRADQDTNAETVIDLDADRKAFTTLAAKLAFAGFSLHQLAHDGYLVSRWDRTFHSNDLAGVRGFCQRAGVAV